MDDKFSYKVETRATTSLKRFEVYANIKYRGKSTNFYTGLFGTPRTYSNVNSNSFSLDPVHYGFDKCYSFAYNWIDMVLYDYHIQSLLNPNTELLKAAELDIKNDMERLSKFESFNHSLQVFLLDRFRSLEDEEPKYHKYASYHRLLDCMLDFQLRSRSILTSKSNNKIEFFESIKEYHIQSYRFNLKEELKTFLTWTVENNIALIDEQDPKWVLGS